MGSVSPGFVDTQLPVDVLGEEAAAAARESFSFSLLGRLAQADEIANAFAWLASPEAAYVTGTNLTVDGGALAVADQAP